MLGSRVAQAWIEDKELRKASEEVSLEMCRTTGEGSEEGHPTSRHRRAQWGEEGTVWRAGGASHWVTRRGTEATAGDGAKESDHLQRACSRVWNGRAMGGVERGMREKLR